MLQVMLRLLTERDLAGIFFSTSPPLVGFVASIVGWVRGVPVAYWAMDLNPDQLIALGKIKETDPLARLLEAVNRFILRRSALVIALDRFMAGRLEQRMPMQQKLLVMPPWPHEEHVTDDAPASEVDSRSLNLFRQARNWGDRFVIMYSGNHSPSNPLATLLEASLRFGDDPDVVFAFIGGGLGKREIEAHIAQHKRTNVVSLPYQPIAALRHSLGAADVHVVSLGDEMVGIIHPCKIYGAMAARRPILYLGPRPSHVSDLLETHGFGKSVTHGDVKACVAAIQSLRRLPHQQLLKIGEVAKSVLAESLTQRLLCGRLCDRMEDALRLPTPKRSPTATVWN